MPQLPGVMAPIVTPFRPSDGEIDHPWLRRHLAYLEAHGCQGAIACGTNGEAASLSVAERKAVLETALSARGSMRVLAGTGAAALPDAIDLTRHAFACGVEGVLVMPPFYFKRPSDAGLTLWFQRLFDAAVPPAGKVLLYHIPQTTAVPITDALIHALRASHGEIVHGIKDSTGDAGEGTRIRAAFPELAYFVGNDHLVAAACAGGGAGSITAAANVFPDLVAAVQGAAPGSAGAIAVQATLSEARKMLDSYPLQSATKAALCLIAGLPPTAVRPPQPELSPAQMAELHTAILNRLPHWRPNTVQMRSTE